VRDAVARLRPAERRRLLDDIAAMIAARELTLGEAARLLRSAVLGMDRASFAQAVGVSERAIAKLEDEPEANPTLATLTRVFRPFGAAIGLAFRPSPDDDDDPDAAARRTELRAALARTRRRRG
jgi:DNA-binding XRE family transcriptional regulator